jgi:hypothetical protein
MAGYAYDRKGNRIVVEIAAHSAGICHSDGRYSRGKITSRRTHLMPAYEMTASEQAEYGNSLNIWQAIRLLQTWSPLIQYGQRFMAEVDPYKKSIIVAQAAEWLAAQTDSQLDDQLVRRLAAVAQSAQGEI